MKQLWMRDSQDKAKAMDAKQKQMEESWVFAEQIKAKEEEIKEVKANIKLARRELEKKDDQILQYTKMVEQIKNSHQSEMETQMKYNVANDKSVQRVNEQLTETEQVVLEMKMLMKDYFDEEIDPDDHLQRRDSDARYKDRSITTADKAKDLLELLLDKVRALEEVEKQYLLQAEERNQLLEKMAAREDVGLTIAFVQHSQGHEDRVGELVRQKQRLADRIEELIGINESTANHLNENVSQLTVDLAAKEAQVKSLKDEMVRLRSVMAFQEKKKQDNKRPTTPRFKNFQETHNRSESLSKSETSSQSQGHASQNHHMIQNGERTHAQASEHSESPVTSERRLVTFPQADGSPRPPIRLSLSRPHTQHNTVKPSASYPQPANNNNTNNSYLPPLTSQSISVRPQRGAPSIPLGRGGKMSGDPFQLVKPTAPSREKTLTNDGGSYTHVMKSSHRRPATRDHMQVNALQRRDNMAGYVTNGNAYKASSYRYG